MEELVANLLRAYRQSISRLDWMSEETKQRAYAKLDMFRSKIGYPEKFRDYSEIEFTLDDLLGNVAAANAFETRRQLAKIGSPVDRDEWLMLPQTVNAYYRPGMNEICFPAAILQKPFFSPDAEAAENYGGIGAVIGHEIGHGFDDQGSQYDGAGNLLDWWTPEDKERFQQKAQALIEQYNGFSPRALPGEHVNGALTVGENIGDLGGLTIALEAYSIHANGDVSLEDAEKLFFNWAYCWRTKRRPELDRQYLTIDPAQPAGVPRQHRAQPRRVPRHLRHRAGRRAVARARGPRPHLVTGPGAVGAHGQAAYARRLDWGLAGPDALVADARPGDVAVVVDVLSFTTTLAVAVEQGVAVHPYPWRAEERRGVRRRARRDAGRRDAARVWPPAR